MSRNWLIDGLLGRMRRVALVLVGAGLAQGALAAEPPDFSGIWRNYRSPAVGDGPWPENPPFTAEARAKIAVYERLVADTGSTPGEFCVGRGMPGSMLGSGGYPMEVIQRPEQITVVYENQNQIRRIYVDGEIDPRELFPTRLGFSTGHWEGDTLVVETISLNESLDQSAAHSEEARIIERYRFGGKSEDGRQLLMAEMTMIDPRFYSEPVTVSKTWVAAEQDVRMLTYDCREPAWEEFLEQRRVELDLD